MKATRNISNFEKIPKRGWLLEGDVLVTNKVDFKMVAGPDREPVQITNDFCDAGVLVELGYRTNSVHGDWVTMSERGFCILCSFLTYLVQQRVMSCNNLCGFRLSRWPQIWHYPSLGVCECV